MRSLVFPLTRLLSNYRTNCKPHCLWRNFCFTERLFWSRTRTSFCCQRFSTKVEFRALKENSRLLLLGDWCKRRLLFAEASTTTTSDKNWSKIRKSLPKLSDDDLEEEFVRGSGPGGQATNKTNNCVVLKHIPTGMVVKCHQTRSQTENRKIARELLREKLDIYYHGDDSVIVQAKKGQQEKKREKTRRSKVKLEKLKMMREMLEKDEEN